MDDSFAMIEPAELEQEADAEVDRIIMEVTDGVLVGAERAPDSQLGTRRQEGKLEEEPEEEEAEEDEELDALRARLNGL